MPRLWIAIKRSLACRQGRADVHDPMRCNSKSRSKNHDLAAILRRRPCRFGCSRSIARLKDVVIHGGKSTKAAADHERNGSCSPRSIGSTEFTNPIAHEVVVHGSRCELRITAVADIGKEIGNLRPGTPGPGSRISTGGHQSPLFARRSMAPAKRFSDHKEVGNRDDGDSAVGTGRRTPATAARGASHEMTSLNGLSCHRCREQFAEMEDLEAHHLSTHAVTELVEGDSSRRILEIICKSSWQKFDNNGCGRIERILKVHNMQRTLSRFEEYRETVKSRASKLPKKHPRCLADGNELLRFHGTTICCSLAADGNSNLCASLKCNVCRIIRHGFSTKGQSGLISLGVFTASTSRRALESIEVPDGDPSIRKALLVCRVIAGRVHRPVNAIEDFASWSGFDSVARKVGPCSNIEELYLLNPQALLPCFVAICKH